MIRRRDLLGGLIYEYRRAAWWCVVLEPDTPLRSRLAAKPRSGPDGLDVPGSARNMRERTLRGSPKWKPPEPEGSSGLRRRL